MELNSKYQNLFRVSTGTISRVMPCKQLEDQLKCLQVRQLCEQICNRIFRHYIRYKSNQKVATRLTQRFTIIT